MMKSSTAKVVKKGAVWSHHGAHARIDPRLIAAPKGRRPRLFPLWATVRDLFRSGKS